MALIFHAQQLLGKGVDLNFTELKHKNEVRHYDILQNSSLASFVGDNQTYHTSHTSFGPSKYIDTIRLFSSKE